MGKKMMIRQEIFQTEREAQGRSERLRNGKKKAALHSAP